MVLQNLCGTLGLVVAVGIGLQDSADGQNPTPSNDRQLAGQISLTKDRLGNPLPEERRREAAGVLSGELHELIDLHLKAKQLHWNVVGPNFRPLHMQLDEIAVVAREGTDVVAERMLALGVSPNGRAGVVAKQSQLPEVPEGLIDDGDVVDVGVQLLEKASQRIHERIDKLADADAVSQDLLIDIAHAIDKQLWMLQAQQD